MIRAAYRHARLALELPFSGGFEIFSQVQRLSLVSRRPTRTPRDTRAHFGLPLDRPAALLSFGGYGMPGLDVAQIDARDWTLVLTDRIQARGAAATPSNIVYLPEDRFRESGFRYEDLIGAVDVVVSKPGYGIVSECITCDKPLLYTSRGIFREYDVFVRDMPRYLRCQFIAHDALFAGRWRDALEGVRVLPSAPERIASNGADVAAEALAGVVDSL
jgi:L-arabinokinase